MSGKTEPTSTCGLGQALEIVLVCPVAGTHDVIVPCLGMQTNRDATAFKEENPAMDSYRIACEGGNAQHRT